MDTSLLAYASIYPTRFRYYDHLYICLGNGVEWIAGGLSNDDVTGLTAEGRAWRDARRKAEREERHARMRDVLGDDWDSKFDAEADEIRAAYLAGTWPDADTLETYRARHRGMVGDADKPNHLYPNHRVEESMVPLGELANGKVAAVTDEWLEDARAASRLLLEHGADMPEHGDGTRVVLAAWTETLAARYGGRWTP